jgi:hypothetical protein
MLEAVLVLAASVADIFRPRWSLLAEIALLRHQLTVLQRSGARPRVTRFDRIALVAHAAVTPTSYCPETYRRRFSHDSPANSWLEDVAGRKQSGRDPDAPRAAPVHHRDGRVRD